MNDPVLPWLANHEKRLKVLTGFVVVLTAAVIALGTMVLLLQGRDQTKPSVEAPLLPFPTPATKQDRAMACLASGWNWNGYICEIGVPVSS